MLNCQEGKVCMIYTQMSGIQSYVLPNRGFVSCATHTGLVHLPRTTEK